MVQELLKKLNENKKKFKELNFDKHEFKDDLINVNVFPIKYE